MAPGIVALKRSGLGLGPWDVLHDGLARHTGVDLGTIGIPAFAVGQGMYIAAGLGAGPRDGLMTGLHRRLGWSIRLARTSIELTALVIGLTLGGSFGVGTFAFALGIGPMVQVTLRWFGF